MFLLQGQIIYEVIGLYPAQLYFMIERNSGVIKVAGNIKDDPLRLSSYTVSGQYILVGILQNINPFN